MTTYQYNVYTKETFNATGKAKGDSIKSLSEMGIRERDVNLAVDAQSIDYSNKEALIKSKIERSKRILERYINE